MVEQFIGEVRIFASTFAPLHWSDCNGQILEISQNDALYSLLGTIYGGDGISTFALPEFRGRVPMHVGQGEGLSPHSLGEKGGAEQVTLSLDEFPSHSHSIQCQSGVGDSPSPANNYIAVQEGDPVNNFSQTTNASMHPTTDAGIQSPNPHYNVSPFQAVRFCISMVGVYPSRN